MKEVIAFYPILIDVEGGSVSRFNSLFNNKEFSQRFFGKIYENDKAKGKLIYKYYLNSISRCIIKISDYFPL